MNTIPTYESRLKVNGALAVVNGEVGVIGNVLTNIEVKLPDRTVWTKEAILLCYSLDQYAQQAAISILTGKLCKSSK